MRAGQGNGLESRLGRSESIALDGFCIKVGAVEVACLLLRTALGRIFRKRFRDLPNLGFRSVGQFSERAPAGAVRGNLVGVEPFAVGVAVEVVSRLNSRIVCAQVEA